MSAQKECFIIMPITTPEPMIEKYRDGEEHFTHVLGCLFKPAIEKAGYNPIPPKAKGADLIQAEIIKNLETADIILCDMSCLNPNVFFEFGIRTSLNKPVCVVKDEFTESVPFDTGILNHHEYKSSLESWDLEREINSLSAHLTASSERSKGENTLWKYFGMKSEAGPYKVAEGTDSKFEYLNFRMDSLLEKMDKITAPSEENLGLFSERQLAKAHLSRYFEREYRTLALIKAEILDHINSDPLREEQVVMKNLCSQFRKKFQSLASRGTLPIERKQEIFTMFDEVSKLETAYFSDHLE